MLISSQLVVLVAYYTQYIRVRQLHEQKISLVTFSSSLKLHLYNLSFEKIPVKGNLSPLWYEIFFMNFLFHL